MLVHDNAMDILKEDSGIFELLADEGSEFNNDFNVRKQSITYAGLEEQGNFNNKCMYSALFVHFIIQLCIRCLSCNESHSMKGYDYHLMIIACFNFEEQNCF